MLGASPNILDKKTKQKWVRACGGERKVPANFLRTACTDKHVAGLQFGTIMN